MKDESKQFEVKLPARITGLVFWGLVFIGLLVAVFILQNAEQNLSENNSKESSLIAHDIENIIEQHVSGSAIHSAGARIRARFSDSISDQGFHAMRLYEGDELLSIGDIGESDEIYKHVLKYYPSDSAELETLYLHLYAASSKEVVAELRKQILLSIGIGVFIFGLLLQRILQKMLSMPFQRMVHTAEKFSQGDSDARFDEQRQDEFGYLGRFINNAIDSILKSKNEAERALERASASEAALVIEKEHAEVTLSSITDTVVTVNMKEEIVYINPAGESLLNIKEDDYLRKPFRDVFTIVEENSGSVIDDPLQKCFETGGIIHLPEHSSLVAHDDTMISIEASIAPMKSDDSGLMGAVIVIQDVSHTRRLTRQLSYQASHDLLTGLYNRRKFEEHLEEILINVREEDRYHTLFYMDLDNFKIVNDTCGHVAGDELLKQLPALFNDVLRSGDLVARLGGDEFGIILENCGLKQAVSIADKIRKKIKAYRFIWDDRTFEIGVSIGVIAINASNAEMSQVLSAADVACYAAKDAGRNRVHVYEPSDEAVNEQYGQMHWTARISRALEEHRFQLYQQPIIGIADHSRNHLEILIRMIDEDGNVIPPGAFMPAAERYGLTPEIDRWVVSEVFRYMGDEGLAGPIKGTDRVFAINLSGDSISDGQLLDFILEEKDRYDISLVNVCFEITETVAISNLSKATAFISELKDHGCQFALDDFGSGLSSFAYLKSLPVDYLKIDGGFVKEICNDPIDRAMVESIQQIGEVMMLDTVAEHVEDDATLQVLKEIGVNYVQGYYLGAPQALSGHIETVAVARAAER